MKRSLTIIVALITAAVFAGTPAAARSYPEQIPLPDPGIYPEGIEVGRGHDFYVGSLLDGRVYEGDLRSGDVTELTPGVEGRFVAGLSFDRRSGLLWGVGGDNDGNKAFAFDTATGEVAHIIPIPGEFINDAVVTRDALYITDSFAATLWIVPLTNRGEPAGPPEALSLTGDFEFVTEGDLPVNLNGIDVTPNGTTLIAVHTALGLLYRIDPVTGVAAEVDLGGTTVPSGDGIVLDGRTLYVVQNLLNTVAVVRLDSGLGSGDVVDTITSPLFRVPATAARFGSSLYLVNARFDEAFPPIFGVPPADPPLEYDVVKVRAR